MTKEQECLSEWISVKNRLPEGDQEVLLLIKTSHGTHIFSGSFSRSFSDFYGTDYTDALVNLPAMKIQDKSVNINITFQFWHISEWDKNNKVTHWMPSPAVPSVDL